MIVMDKQDAINLPTALYLVCEKCGNEDMADVVFARKTETGKIMVKLKCRSCGAVSNQVFAEMGQISVRLIISRDAESESTILKLDPTDILEVGQEIYLDNERIKITSLEIPVKTGSKRVNKAEGKDITTIWAMNYDTINVGVSINQGMKTISRRITVPPEEEFIVGDDMYVDGLHVLIHKIMDVDGRRLRPGESVQAADIKRIYAKAIKRR